MRLPVGFHLKNPSSRMMSRVINDVNWIQNAVSGVLKDLFQQSLTFLILFGVVFYQNWQLTLLSSVVIPLSVYPMVRLGNRLRRIATIGQERRSEEHTSELQSPCNLVCRLLLEKKKKKKREHTYRLLLLYH